ncbi:MAG: urea transporter [Burkholderiales bacterium]|jgi:urea transporter|nr:urea transporter [Burkholderiales bacterium]
MAAVSSVAANTRLFTQAWLRGCAQLAFCDSPLTGFLVVAGVALVAPLAGIGALIGALFGTLVGRTTRAYSRDEWAWGLAGFNPAIVGLMGGALVASREIGIPLLLGALGASVALDVAFRRLLGRFRLPALSLAAVTTLYVTSLLVAPAGAWLWVDAPGNALVPYGLLGAALVVVAAAIKGPLPAVWAFLLGACALVAGMLAGYAPAEIVGLWAVAVPLASFGMHAVFLRSSLAGLAAGTLAAVFAALVWWGWHASPLGDWLPPLVTPFILGVWLSFLSVRLVAARPPAQPLRWKILRGAVAARREGRGVVALAQRVSDAPISGFVSGTWLDPSQPRSAFTREHVAASPGARRALWDAAERLRAESARLHPGALLGELEKLYAAGWLSALIVQDVSWPGAAPRPRSAFSVHGDLDRTRCLDCGDEGPWPPRALWRRVDLRCAACQGPLAPDLTPYGFEPDAMTAQRLSDLAKRCGLVLVLGEEAAEPATEAFLERVRDAGGTVAFVSGGGTRHVRRASDLSLSEPPERVLAFLARGLGAAMLSRWWRPRSGRAREALGAARQGEGAGP